MKRETVPWITGFAFGLLLGLALSLTMAQEPDDITASVITSADVSISCTNDEGDADGDGCGYWSGETTLCGPYNDAPRYELQDGWLVVLLERCNDAGEVEIHRFRWLPEAKNASEENDSQETQAGSTPYVRVFADVPHVVGPPCYVRLLPSAPPRAPKARGKGRA